MVVDKVQDLDRGAVGQVPVGGVGLPAFVGQRGLEADEGGARSLVGLWGDQAMPTEDAPNGAARGRRFSQARGDVVRDCLGSGVVTRGKELLPQLEDGGDDLLAGRSRRGSWSPGVRLKGLVAAPSNPGDQLVEPAPGDAVGLGDLGRATFRDEHGVDHIALQSHAGTSFR